MYYYTVTRIHLPTSHRTFYPEQSEKPLKLVEHVGHTFRVIREEAINYTDAEDESYRLTDAEDSKWG